MAKCRVLEFSRELVPTLFRRGIHRGYEVTDGALPADAKIIDIRMQGAVVQALVWSDTFELIKDGGLIPTLPDVVFKALDQEGELKAQREELLKLTALEEMQTPKKKREQIFVDGYNFAVRSLNKIVEDLKKVRGW